MTRKRICIISMSAAIERDGRVLRQIDYLSRHFDITLIGYGVPQPEWQHVDWCPVDRDDTVIRALLDRFLLIVGRAVPLAYELWLWTRPRYRQILRDAIASRAEAFHANDWAVVPLALEAAARIAREQGGKNAPVVYDIHEYWELENETNRTWMRFFSPLIRYINQKYAPRAAATTTVCDPIAKRYHDEIGLNPAVVYSAPALVPIQLHRTERDSIKIIHHGSARRNRYMETIIEAAALLDERFHLVFMLVDADNNYVGDLQRLAGQIAPGRITFRDPVPPSQIVSAIADGDIGLCFIPPTTYNYKNALPNKFFESLSAGLAICTGPSPAMVALVEQHRCGVVTADFTAQSLAQTLNRMTTADIDAMRQAARNAAEAINADTEMGKLVALHQRLVQV